MNPRMIGRTTRILATLAALATASSSRANLLVNGDFEAAPILGPGQSGVPIGQAKAIFSDPTTPLYDVAISGISGWTYATPVENGTGSDHGLARRNAEFGRPAGGQSAFINNWGRMMSQTVAVPLRAGDVLEAAIDFGTLGDDADGGRAGVFYLVAGQADPSDPDQFAAGSIILAQISAGNPTWSQFTPDVVVGNDVYTRLSLSYTVQAADVALGLPITIAFKTVAPSVGPTFWDDASLTVTPVPEPSALGLAGVGAASLAALAARRRRP